MKTIFATLLAGSLFVSNSSLAAPPIPEFRHQEIDNQIAIGYGLAIGDVDGDKKPDILVADKKQFVWYQNPTWKKHVMAENLTQRDNVCIAARDLDGDGKVEVAVGGEWNPGDTLNSGSVHYLVPPSDRTGKWTPIQLPNEPTVHRMRWITDGKGAHELAVLPLHGKGNRGGKGAGVKFLAYKFPKDPAATWATRVLSDTLHATHNLDRVQWDNDPAEECLIAGVEGVHLVNGDKVTQLTSNGAGETRMGQLKGGKFLATVEPMHGGIAKIYVQDANKNWTGKVIDADLSQGHAIATADILGIGSDQVVYGWRGRNKQGKYGVALYAPMNDEGTSWRKTTVDDEQMACEDLRVADLNGDGKLEIIAVGRATKNLKIYHLK